MRSARAGSFNNSSTFSTHSSSVLTRKPVSPSTICNGMPPTFPATTGRPFHNASDTALLSQRLLDDDPRRPLERVHLDVTDAVEVREDVDVPVLAGPADGAL